MDHYQAVVQSKMSKVESSLTDINNEISAVNKHLSELKESCSTVVSNLKKITKPAKYLQEFVNVNAFLLKTLSFLTEINCKFEVLDISEKFVNNLEFPTDEVLHVGSKLNECCESTTELNSNLPKKSSKEITNRQPLTVGQKGEKEEQEKAEESHQDYKKDIQTVPITNGCNKNSELTSTVNSQKKIEEKNHKETIKQNSESKNENISSNMLNKLVINSSCDSSCSGSVSAIESPVSQIIDWWDCRDATTGNVANVSEKDEQTVKDCQSKYDLYDIKPVLLRNVGEEYDITIENIISPSEFYVSIKDQSDLLLELEKELKLIPVNKSNSNGTNNQDKKALLNKEINSYALAYSKCEEMWCRAKIISRNISSNEDFVIVFLLDYGEFKCVSINDIQPLPDYLRKYPAFTVKCHLHDVFPVDGVDENTETLSWGKDCTEAMRCVTEYSKKIRMRIVSNDVGHSSSSLPVKLFLVDKNKWVHEVLVQKRYATCQTQSPKSVKHTEREENLNNWNPMKEDFESYQNSYNVDINDPGIIIYGYAGKDYERICAQYAKTGYCFKGNSCRKEHSKLDLLGYTTDKEEIYKNAFNNLPIPPPKSVLNVQITCVLSFNQFFCFSEELDVSSEKETLHTLVKFINKPENVKNMRKLMTPPSIGQIVMACYSADDAWYRARVLESEPENDSFNIVFVDFGNKEVLPLSQIRAMEARYLHLPFQAIECFIFGIEQNPKKPVSETLDFLTERVGDGQLKIEVVDVLPGEQVHLLVNAFDQNGMNIGDYLIENEHAFLKKEEMIISSASESIPG